MSPRESLHILDALENLNVLVDAEGLEELEVTEDAHIISHKEEAFDENTYWTPAAADQETLSAIKKTFLSVYEYLQTYYSQVKKTGDTKKLVEGVNTIMVLVGEAAGKLDHLGALFQKKISEIPEYQKLQNFYKNKVIKETFQSFSKIPLSKRQMKQVDPEQIEWEEELREILGEEQTEVLEIAGVHLLNDIEAIKRDHLYELFFLKNEQGHNFYTFDLARNLKLACDFGEFTEEYFGEDPLLQIKNWEDKALYLYSIEILKSSRTYLDKFYKELGKYKDMELVNGLHKACMALMLSANPRNLIRQFSLKGCHRYFYDFLIFLREVVANRDYQKFILYSPPSNRPFFQDVINLTQHFCYLLFSKGADFKELHESLNKLIERKGGKKEKTFSASLYASYLALEEVFKAHPSGPVFKAVDIVREEEEQAFDPLSQGNFPDQIGILHIAEEEIKLVRMACPIHQKRINKAYIIEEFKTFLRACSKNERILFCNFQDRTSWKEHARCAAIEELSKQAEFADNLTVITLAKDTDFYNQMGSYEKLDDAEEFKKQLKEHLSDESTGYFFSGGIKKILTGDYMDALIAKIHQVFFEKRKTLSFVERLDFIEAAYNLILLKSIESKKPTMLVFSSKDGLDTATSSFIMFATFLKFSFKSEWEEEEIKQLNTLLFGKNLMIRERNLHKERIDRLYTFIKLLEAKPHYLKEFFSSYTKKNVNLSL